MNSKISLLFAVFLTVVCILPSANSVFSCADNRDGFYNIPGLCSYFTQCVDGKEEGWVCLADLFYVYDKGGCFWPEYDWCDMYPIPRKCSETRPDGLIPSPTKDNCQTFIDCSIGEHKESKCPGNTRFNPARRGCEPVEDFICDEK